MIYYICDKSTGQITTTGVSSDVDSVPYDIDTELLIKDIEADGMVDYHDLVTGKVKKRPRSNAILDKAKVKADKKDESTIKDIPKGSEVTMAGTGATVINDGSLKMTFDKPGKYNIEIRNFPYLDEVYEIDVD